MGRSVSLVGPRCCGKTSTGKELAEILGIPFVDADEKFVDTLGSIDDFVKQHGWDIFRQYETKIIEGICKEYQGRQIVLTPGGGAVAHNQGNEYRKRNVELLISLGQVYYLLPTKSLEENARILTERELADQASAGQRPPLTDENDPFKRMLKTVKERNHHYINAADGIIYTKGKTIQEVAQVIAMAVR